MQKQFIERLSRIVADALFPPRCPLCDEFAAERAVPCRDCEASLIRLDSDALLRGIPASALSQCRSCFAYDGKIRDALHNFKYGDRQDLIRFLAREMSMEAMAMGGFDLVVPVPLSRRRLAGRGFNQAALLARAISRATGVPADLDSLARVLEVPPQVGLEREERIKNVRNAFGVRRGRETRFAGREVLLVDDVMTTGATLAECARSIRFAGASSVWALTVARVL